MCVQWKGSNSISHCLLLGARRYCISMHNLWWIYHGLICPGLVYFPWRSMVCFACCGSLKVTARSVVSEASNCLVNSYTWYIHDLTLLTCFPVVTSCWYNMMQPSFSLLAWQLDRGIVPSSRCWQCRACWDAAKLNTINNPLKMCGKQIKQRCIILYSYSTCHLD